MNLRISVDREDNYSFVPFEAREKAFKALLIRIFSGVGIFIQTLAFINALLLIPQSNFQVFMDCIYNLALLLIDIYLIIRAKARTRFASWILVIGACIECMRLTLVAGVTLGVGVLFMIAMVLAVLMLKPKESVLVTVVNCTFMIGLTIAQKVLNIYAPPPNQMITPALEVDYELFESIVFIPCLMFLLIVANNIQTQFLIKQNREISDVLKEIDKARGLNQALAEKEKQLRIQVTRAEEEERKRIARELHDDTLGKLSRLYSYLSSLKSLPTEQTNKLLHLVNEVDNSARRNLASLHAAELDFDPLYLAVENVALRLCENIELDLNVDDELAGKRFVPEIETAIIRVLQEALNNTIKHSKANRVAVNLRFDRFRNTLVLSITDNGVGFNVPTDLKEKKQKNRYGVAGFFERAERIDGFVHINSYPGGGTQIIFEAPYVLQEGYSRGKVLT